MHTSTQRTPVNPALAGLAGAAAGAALGVALSHTDTRKKIVKTIKRVKTQGMHQFNTLKEQARNFGEHAEIKVEKGKKAAQKNLKAATK